MNSVNEKFKAIEDWQEYLNQVNPNIMKLGLDRVKAVAEKLEVDRFDNSKIITVAGTNGKGSTATMLAKILDNSGIRTGLYTSESCTGYYSNYFDKYKNREKAIEAAIREVGGIKNGK